MNSAADNAEADRVRFRNLLALAEQSPFAGERENALAAAGRLAGKYDMTMSEACRFGLGNRPPPAPRPAPQPETGDLSDEAIRRAKSAREASLRDALARGLKLNEEAPRRTSRGSAQSRERRNPYAHARTLLEETSLPLAEIVDITGLDIYQVVGMKLKMRKASQSGVSRAW